MGFSHIYYLASQYDYYINDDLDICENEMYYCRPKTGTAIVKTTLMTFFWLMGEFNLKREIENNELNWFLYFFFFLLCLCFSFLIVSLL